MDPLNSTELGTVGVILIVLFWVLHFFSKMLLSKKGLNPTPNCKLDPIVRQRVEDIHQMTTDTENQKHEGRFRCQWRNRDEIRDFKEIMLQNTAAIKALTVELRLTRNGKK